MILALLLAQAVLPAPRLQPTVASCWVSSCTQARSSEATEIAPVCPLGTNPRMMTFDPADASKGEPIIVCLCCPTRKVKTPPRVFEEKNP